MVKQTTTRVSERPNVSARPNHTFLLIHGYTGSPTDFNGLPEFLRKTFSGTVEIPLLPGHGSKVQDLDGLTLEHFIAAAEEKLKEILARGDRVILIGHSLGGQIVLYLAARYPVAGVFTSAIPYQLKFPFNIPGISLLGYIKKYWPKKIPEEEIERRKSAFYYSAMPAYAISLVHDANRLLKSVLPNVTCPILTIQSRHEHISDDRGQELIHETAASQVKESFILEKQTHGIFYSGEEEAIYQRIVNFITTHGLLA